MTAILCQGVRLLEGVRLLGSQEYTAQPTKRMTLESRPTMYVPIHRIFGFGLGLDLLECKLSIPHSQILLEYVKCEFPKVYHFGKSLAQHIFDDSRNLKL